MTLLLQLNADLPERFPDDSRWLYVFGCVHGACNRRAGSVRAFRGVKRLRDTGGMGGSGKGKTVRNAEGENQERERAGEGGKKVDLGASLFGGSMGISGNTNPFSTAPEASAPKDGPPNPFAGLSSPSTLAAKPPQNPSQNATPNPSAAADLPATFAEKARISSPDEKQQQQPASDQKTKAGPSALEPWPPRSAFPRPYRQFYLDADYETLSAPSTDVPASVRMETDPDDGADGGGRAAAAAAVEKDALDSSVDNDFLRFSSRLEHNPEQVLRYEFGGTPLLYSTTDSVGRLFVPASSSTSSSSSKVTVQPANGGRQGSPSGAPPCLSCGAPRVFELQLTPHAIAVLEEDRDIGLGGGEGMEWGSVVVCVCARDCGPRAVGEVGYREEWAGVQWER